MDNSQQLRENVRMLGDLLGRVLEKQGGSVLLDTVEEIRSMSKLARNGDAKAWATLSHQLSKLDTDEAIPIGRAFALFLALAPSRFAAKRAPRTASDGLLLAAR